MPFLSLYRDTTMTLCQWSETKMNSDEGGEYFVSTSTQWIYYYIVDMSHVTCLAYGLIILTGRCPG